MNYCWRLKKKEKTHGLFSSYHYYFFVEYLLFGMFWAYLALFELFLKKSDLGFSMFLLWSIYLSCFVKL